MRVERYTEHGLADTRDDDVTIPPEVVNRDALADRVAQAIDTLEDAGARWDNLTAAQRTAAMSLAVRTVARLARLLLNRLDAAP